MVLRQCTICGRRFNKTEHFKRHERSHTREKPYKCSYCGKAFSRSDVLFRHSKCHTEKRDSDPLSPSTTQSIERRSTISEGIRPQVVRSQQSEYSNRDVDQDPPGISLTQTLSPPNYGGTAEKRSPSKVRHGSIDHPTPYVEPTSLQQRNFRPQINSDWARQSASIHQQPSPAQKPADSLAYGTPVANIEQPTQMAQSDVHHQTQYSGTGMEWLPPTGLPSGDFHDPFQMWLFPSLGDLDQSPDFLQTFNTGATPNFSGPEMRLPIERVHNDTSDRSRTIKTVPRERFARVQKCWAPRPHRLHRMMPSLWSEIMVSSLDNVFMEENQVVEPYAKSTTNWGLDADCRYRLKDTFRTPAPSTWPSPRINGNLDPVIAPNLSDASEFPPAEILDIALGLFFRRFHPSVPFIHIPTFTVRNTPEPLLFAMCLIGLSILGTTGAIRFVSKMFPSFLQRVSADLTTSVDGTSPATQQLTNFATALLVLNLAVMTGDKDTLQQSQMLYVSLVAMVQQNGLFATCDGQDLDELLNKMNESEHQWKAWSRVESTKRLILSLLTLDSWYPNLLYRPPITRSEAISVYAPCDEGLFQAKSATQWQCLVRSGKHRHAPIIRLKDLHASRIDPAIPLGYLGSSTLLALLQIQILESYHRLFPADQRQIGCLIPWQLYNDDLRARSLTSAILASIASAGPTMHHPDTNCLVLWHSLCIMLLADFRMFELAAGRHGAAPATNALDKIAQWSQTTSARRAIVHAASNFKLMSERKVSDNMTVHSVHALFASALVLALYLFMAPPSTNHSNRTTVELIDTDVDWTELSDIGFTHPHDEDRDMMSNMAISMSANGNSHGNGPSSYRRTHSSTSIPRHDADLSPIHHFILYGGTVALSGVRHQGGYESARRVLLDFANLMDGISGRKLRMFTQVLHIMSDDLMNVDPAA